MPVCCDCQKDLAKAKFSKNQLRKDPASRRCKQCVQILLDNENAQAAAAAAASTESIVKDVPEPVISEEKTEVLPVDTQVDQVTDTVDANVKVDKNVEETPTVLTESPKVDVEDASNTGEETVLTESPKVDVEDASNTGEAKIAEKNDDDKETSNGVDIEAKEQDAGATALAESPKVDVEDTSNKNESEAKNVETRVEENDDEKETSNGADIEAKEPVSGEIEKEVIEIKDVETIQNSALDKDKDNTLVQSSGELSRLTCETISDLGDTPVPAEVVGNRIRLGICAMDKKARSKPMGEILSRLDDKNFEIVYFGDEVILEKPVTEWPTCDVLIAFYSNGYPLDKAEEYVELRKPFVLNDLKMQRVLQDRRRVYELLMNSGIDVPKHVFMNRDGYKSNLSVDEQNEQVLEDSDCEEDELIEHDDSIEVNGVVIHKPFVEKPVDADDHNIAIYYPSSAGGGCKKLFRKVGDRSSEFYPDINDIRREGSYIYEEFVETQGTDVKMYTVGPDYGHAEARKSPTVDGKVERNEDGKEVRFPVILTLREKEIARRIVINFKQYVCGFDLLRVQEGDSLISYVCDVNGWSFVKKSRKYYSDCAQILTEHILAAVKPKELHGFSAIDPLMRTIQDFVGRNTPRRKRQKAFVRGTSSGAVDSCPESPTKAGENEEEIVSDQNAAATLEEGAMPVREMPDMLMNNPASMSATSSLNGDDDTATTTGDNRTGPTTHQEELRCVITVVRHGDRTPKQKLKVEMSEPLLLEYFHKHCKSCKKDLKIKAKQPMTEFLACVHAMIDEKEKEATPEERKVETRDTLYQLRHMRDVLERWKISGLNRKLQLKPKKWNELIDEKGNTYLRCCSVQLILKWGGNLTKLGEKQAIRLGERFRDTMYPNTPSGGILRLHSTFRHDMKIKTSDEGRVMKTAAAFAKGMLELEGSIPPILVSLVHKEKDSLHMLDPSGNKEVKAELETCKEEINKHLQKDFDVSKATAREIEAAVGPKEMISMEKALRKVGNPRKALFAIRDTIAALIDQLDEMLGLMSSDVENKFEGGEGLVGDEDDDEALSGIKLYKGETLLELTERWRLLHKKLYDEDADTFDLSRVPDVHDNVRFDMLHNPHLGLTSTLEKLYNLAKSMADCVVPQEYGTTIDEKRSVGNKICHALLDKIKYDLIIARTDNQVDMRYMINLDYSADLPINTMGRRIRTRLYFTSESHLHTLLNVLRFPSKAPGAKKSPLSKRGVEIISAAPELCYLTQVVIRLFEDTSKDVSDPKRFRIEILFSPGATATPLHMSELKRHEDSSRFDTEPLQRVSSDYLTCQEVEDYFSQSIREGTPADDDDEGISVPESKIEETQTQDKAVALEENVLQTDDTPSEVGTGEEEKILAPQTEKSVKWNEKELTLCKSESVEDEKKEDVTGEEEIVEIDEVEEDATENTIVEKSRIDAMAKILTKQFFWTSLATLSFVFGIGFIVISREVVAKDFKASKRWRR